MNAYSNTPPPIEHGSQNWTCQSGRNHYTSDTSGRYTIRVNTHNTGAAVPNEFTDPFIVKMMREVVLVLQGLDEFSWQTHAYLRCATSNLGVHVRSAAQIPLVSPKEFAWRRK